MNVTIKPKRVKEPSVEQLAKQKARGQRAEVRSQNGHAQPDVAVGSLDAGLAEEVVASARERALRLGELPEAKLTYEDRAFLYRVGSGAKLDPPDGPWLIRLLERHAKALKGNGQASVSRESGGGQTTNGTNPTNGANGGKAKPVASVTSAANAQLGLPTEIDCDVCHPHPKNRHSSDKDPDVVALAESIQEDDQLQEIIVRVPPAHWKLPPGHVQIVVGERRWRACKLAGRGTVRAKVRDDIDDAMAIKLIAIENSKRKDLNPIERARLIETLCAAVAEGGAGMTKEAAAKCVGLQDGSSASNLVRLLKLPKVWQERVAGGELDQSWARLLLPFVEAPKLLDRINADYQKAMKSKDSYARREWESRSELERHLKWLLRENTRPIDGTETVHYTYGQVGAWGSYPRLFELTDDVRKKLEVRTFAIDGKEVELATNAKAFDKLNIPLIKKKVKPRPTPGGKSRTKGKGATSKPLTAAQKKKAEEQAAQKLEKATTMWRHNWLMEQVAAAIDRGQGAAARERLLVYLAANGPENFYDDGVRPAIADCVRKHGGRASSNFNDLWKNLGQLGDDAAALRDCGTAACRSVLLHAEKYDVYYPVLETEVVEDLARMCGVDVQAEWDKLQARTKEATAKLTEFFDLYSAEQLIALAGELGVWVAPGTERKATLKLLLNYSSPGSTKRLPLPKCIKPLAIAGGKRKGAKAAKR